VGREESAPFKKGNRVRLSEEGRHAFRFSAMNLNWVGVVAREPLTFAVTGCISVRREGLKTITFIHHTYLQKING
jgi:hypothetical protein